MNIRAGAWMLAMTAMMCACKNDLKFEPKKSADELMVNALIRADERRHTVFVALSNTETVKKVEDAVLRCKVNGVVAAMTDAEDAGYVQEYYNADGAVPKAYLQKPYSFDAVFHEGDKVELEVEANRGKYHAKVSLVVPKKAVINEVKLSEVESAKKRRLVELSMTDASDDKHFYALNAVFVTHYKAYKSGTPVSERWGKKFLEVDASGDPIVSESSKKLISRKLDSDAGLKRKSGNYFTDRAFNGGKAELKVYVNDNALHSFLAPEEVVDADSRVVSRWVRMEVLSISFEYFNYLNALFLLGRERFNDLFSEPIRVPDNVDGGIGFVGIGNGVSYDVALWDVSA